MGILAMGVHRPALEALQAAAFRRPITYIASHGGAPLLLHLLGLARRGNSVYRVRRPWPQLCILGQALTCWIYTLRPLGSGRAFYAHPWPFGLKSAAHGFLALRCAAPRCAGRHGFSAPLTGAGCSAAVCPLVHDKVVSLDGRWLRCSRLPNDPTVPLGSRRPSQRLSRS